jgi:hypothetical protein
MFLRIQGRRLSMSSMVMEIKTKEMTTKGYRYDGMEVVVGMRSTCGNDVITLSSDANGYTSAYLTSMNYDS